MTIRQDIGSEIITSTRNFGKVGGYDVVRDVTVIVNMESLERGYLGITSEAQALTDYLARKFRESAMFASEKISDELPHIFSCEDYRDIEKLETNIRFTNDSFGSGIMNGILKAFKDVKSDIVHGIKRVCVSDDGLTTRLYSNVFLLDSNDEEEFRRRIRNGTAGILHTSGLLKHPFLKLIIDYKVTPSERIK